MKPKQNRQQWYKRTKRRQHLKDSLEGYLSSRFFMHGIELDELTEEEKKELVAIDSHYRRTITKIET
ncbi:hypothetical protein AKK44_07555 [Streptococcus phocae]|uniref:Uncharacterized protein n=1 Tax=Streptococcus phocae TaxID=119224 RepID=A0A0N8FX15_9STRE|nr:hypothetical protein AKK44_07555 [Streptococcus phocae]